MHSDPQFADCPPGATRTLLGWLWFYEGDEIDVSLSFLHADGDIDLRLLDPTGNSRVLSLGVTDEERIEFEADVSGRWAVQVFGVGIAENTYDLVVHTGCGEDGLEAADNALLSRQVHEDVEPLASEFGQGDVVHTVNCNQIVGLEDTIDFLVP